MSKISVVIPCLNMINYIEECMISVLKQTLDDIEILVIDAGSTDGTLAILDTYAHSDSRIKVLHSEKKSYGYQVNMGIAKAQGEYIGIVDADDRIVQDMYETLYNEAVKTGADYVKGTACGFYTIQDKYTYRYEIIQFQKDKYKDGRIQVVPRELPELLQKDCFLWYGIYRREFMKKVRFHESPGASYQDAGGLLQTQMRAEKAIYINKMVYEYRKDNMFASEYNPRAFELILNEYEWERQYLEREPLCWHKTFYQKWFLHTLSRYDVMVISGYLEENALGAIAKIRERFSWAMEKSIFAETDFNDLNQRKFKLFMSNPRKLYEEMKKEYECAKKRLYEVIQAAKGKKCVIFGSGCLGTFLYLQMLHNNVDSVAVFCDTNALREEMTVYELPVLLPENAVRKYPDARYIIANKNSVQEMQDCLLQLGIDEKKIFYYTSGADHRLFRTRIDLADI